MLYLVIIVAILLIGLGIHQYFNIGKDFKYPSIIYFIIGFILYIVAMIQYRTDLFEKPTIIHEILLTTIFGLILYWVNSHRNKTKDTICYTIMIVVLTLLLAMVPVSSTVVISIQELLVVRMALSIILLAFGVYVIYKQVKDKVSESFPLLYLLAFIYWISLAYWL